LICTYSGSKIDTMKTKLALILALLIARAALGAEHPGNVFVAGDDVRIMVPAKWNGWRAIDIDGKEIGRGAAKDKTASLGHLPVGYFELRETGGPGMVTAAVLAKNSPSEDTPIAIDVAASWFYAEPQQIRDACTLCRLAGVKWVRDRASWPELETARGVWAADTRYERAMRIQHEMGLKILQVNHISPSWASKDPKHFPEDLRDVFNFYRGLAKRWKGLADAIEPWNEPDIIEFGGHTGCEIASFQKAAYLGLKAGNPEFAVNGSVFAIDRPETLDEFGANEVYLYCDRYDLHHYVALNRYPQAYARHRAVSGGRPMWTTEFNLNIFWSDEKTHEPSEEDLRVQGYRISKAFSQALHEGTEKAFQFILGHYVERQIQYGLVHTDLTPRPAYVAFAAVGRFLNAAKPIGRIDLGNEKLKAYVFRKEVDGAKGETVVAWSETNPMDAKIRPAEKTYDYLGRELPNAHKLHLTREPIFVLLPRGGSKRLKVEPPPPKAKWLPGKACPVVLQLVGKGDMNKSAFQLGNSNELRLVAYNFGTKPVRGELDIEGATIEKMHIEMDPASRNVRTLSVNDRAHVTARLKLDDGERAIVSARIFGAQLKN
jgi:hypothetical protein